MLETSRAPFITTLPAAVEICVRTFVDPKTEKPFISKSGSGTVPVIPNTVRSSSEPSSVWEYILEAIGHKPEARKSRKKTIREPGLLRPQTILILFKFILLPTRIIYENRKINPEDCYLFLSQAATFEPELKIAMYCPEPSEPVTSSLAAGFSVPMPTAPEVDTTTWCAVPVPTARL